MINDPQAPTLLTDIAYTPDIDELAGWLRMTKEDHLAELRELAAAAGQIARPKVVVRLLFIGARTEDTTAVAGTLFTSRVMAVNLRDVNRVFAFVATAGRELEAWGQAIEGMLPRFWAGMIQEQALHAALQALHDYLLAQYQIEKLSMMNPGSLEDWPLQEQRPLFDLLGDTNGAIGVQLLQSCLMAPDKTVSGILFEAEQAYFNCQLCPLAECPIRRAPYDAELYAQKYAR